jgi:hypothetical protein
MKVNWKSVINFVITVLTAILSSFCMQELQVIFSVLSRKASLPTLALQPRRILWKTSSTVSPLTIPMPRF